jgi:hypothetical protein
MCSSGIRLFPNMMNLGFSNRRIGRSLKMMVTKMDAMEEAQALQKKA